jgi:hypothetical protein
METPVNRRSLFRLAGLIPVATATALVTPRHLPADIREDLDVGTVGHVEDHQELAKRINELVRFLR